MSAPLCLCVLAAISTSVTAVRAQDSARVQLDSRATSRDDFGSRKVELYDGVRVTIPDSSSNTTKLFSLEMDLHKGAQEGRGKQKQQQKLMQRILPLFIMPFLLQSAIVPLFLSMLKFMLLKSLTVGKIALLLILLNAFKNHNSVRGKRDAEMADVHYGYHGNGMEEYGAYIN